MRSSPSCSSLLKLAAAAVAVGLHVVVLAVVLSARPADVPLGQARDLEIQFVELGPATSALPVAAQSSTARKDTRPDPTREPVAGPVSAPGPLPPPDPEPAVRMPKPVAPVPPPRPPRLAVHHSVPETRSSPAARPAPAVPAARPAPARIANPTSAPGPSRSMPAPAGPGAPDASASTPAAGVDPNRPRTVGQVAYLGPPPRPTYPRLSERRGEQGHVVLRVLISPEGRAEKIEVRQSSGYGRLDEAAIAALRRARFRPYTEDGVAYRALADIPFDFVL